MNHTVMLEPASSQATASETLLRAELAAAQCKIEEYARLLEGDARRTEERHRAIIEHLTDGIVTIDGGGAVESFNPAAQHIFGYTAEEVIGQNVKLLMPDAYHMPIDTSSDAYRRTGAGASIDKGVREIAGYRKDGKAFPLQVGVSETNIGDRTVFIAVARDLTSQKKEEQNIIAAETSRLANVAKSEFLASMSHEIRTPLNGVIGNLELLAQTALDREQLEIIADADGAAIALLALIGNILDYSKIEAGKLTVEIGDIHPGGILDEAVAVLQSGARDKGLFVVSTCGADVPVLVRGDGTRLRQILLNLIGNAMKFTQQGGIHVGLTVDSWTSGACTLRFDVRDSGAGFDEAFKHRLFHPFVQDRAATSTAEGTGLGLSISRSLVESFGGVIGCEAVPGEGASFWFTLPVAVVKRALPCVKPDFSGKVVLMVGVVKKDTQWLEDYFLARGATIENMANLDAAALAVKSNEPVHRGVAIVLSSEPVAGTPEAIRLLRRKGIVSLLHAADGSHSARCLALRNGYAAVLPIGTSADYLDRNIWSLTGQAPARVLRIAQHGAIALAVGAGLKNKRVLVLEDRLLNQTVVKKQLGKFGIVCVLAANGIKGLETLSRENFDLILCDCSMPEMNGYEFTRALRKLEMSEPGRQRLPVIALTANAFREDEERCFEAGMNDFITKPVTMERLGAVLAKWLDPTAAGARAFFTNPDTIAVPEIEGSPAIDLAALAEILGSHEKDAMGDFLADFMSVARTSLELVEAAVTSHIPKDIKAAAHGAKGEAHTVAASRLGELYSDVERNAATSDERVLQALLAEASLETTRIGKFRIANFGTRAL